MEVGESEQIGVWTIRQTTDCVKLFNEEHKCHRMGRYCSVIELYGMVELSRCAALNRSAKSIDFRKQSCFRMLMVLLNEIEIEMFCFQKLILGDYSLSTH